MALRKKLHNKVHKYLGFLLLANTYAERQGFKQLAKKIITRFKQKLKTFIVKRNMTSNKLSSVIGCDLPHWSEINKDSQQDLNPIGVYKTKIGESYTTIVTDSIGQNSLFGGVATALIFGTLLANKRDQPLRIITRIEPGFADNYAKLLNIYDISLKHNLVLDFSPRSSTNPNITYHPNDLFITTSWWTTYSCLQRIESKSIVYLIQEDERFFYPVSDLYIECEKIMSNPKIRYVVNSELLWRHFKINGFNNIIENGTYFEPNFDRKILPSRIICKEKQNLFFYARPNNPRNLYRSGIGLINKALLLKIINPEEWNIVLVGNSIEPFKFDDGTVPQIISGLTWAEYLNLISNTDIGISLMATPHPSYPPLDLAAAGAVVITNKYGIKQTLNKYSQNILVCNLDTDDLLNGLKRAVKMCNNKSLVDENRCKSSLFRTWEECLSDPIAANL